ncbi:hypothetical protein HK102_004011 [Quaeritorhiza haematococci]|nr:hypothetical protein HK102_004011 [Quaeritorhiza haematococci]
MSNATCIQQSKPRGGKAATDVISGIDSGFVFAIPAARPANITKAVAESTNPPSTSVRGPNSAGSRLPNQQQEQQQSNDHTSKQVIVNEGVGGIGSDVFGGPSLITPIRSKISPAGGFMQGPTVNHSPWSCSSQSSLYSQIGGVGDDVLVAALDNFESLLKTPISESVFENQSPMPSSSGNDETAFGENLEQADGGESANVLDDINFLRRLSSEYQNMSDEEDDCFGNEVDEKVPPAAEKSAIDAFGPQCAAEEDHGAQINVESPGSIPEDNAFPYADIPAFNFSQEAVDLSLASRELGLPQGIIQTYADHGITNLYEWQVNCLMIEGVLTGQRNLLYSAPTSAGKTMVAELLVLRRVLSSKKKAIMILPFVAIVSEKTKYLQTMFASENFKIVGYFGNNGSSSFDNVDIAICTIEKANSLVNKIMEEGKMDTLGIVVVDELHMIGDDSRGYLLELLLTKMRFVASNQLQIVGMSATLPNIDVLADWLDAELYITDYRPVPLHEYIKIGNLLYDTEFKVIRQLDYPKDPRDPDMLVPLVWEVVSQGNSVLIFCSTKDGCEKSARNISYCLSLPATDRIVADRKQLLVELARTPGGLDETLESTVPYGVAYHHSGLTIEERELIEDAFRAGCIHTLAATSTLASGVNLPARRVIFRSPGIGRQFIDPQSYKQMKGRAGRKGKDTMGESILICPERDKRLFAYASLQLKRTPFIIFSPTLGIRKVQELVQSDLQPVHSCLTSERKGMKRALLEVIVSGVVSTEEDIRRYVKCTLLYAENQSFESARATADEALTFLQKEEFIAPVLKCEETDGSSTESLRVFRPSKLGQATVASALSPEESTVVFGELTRALHRFVLADELHIVYQVTPTYLHYEANWNLFMKVYGKLSETRREIADAIGVSEGFLIRASIGQMSSDPVQQLIHRRFFAALMLNDLVHEVDFVDVMHRYGVNRGTLQSLQTLSSTFAGMVTVFCQKLGWINLELLLHQFQDRLNFGVEKELIELVKVPHVKGVRARILWQAGYKTIASLACASAEEIFEHLVKSSPFKSTKDDDSAKDYQRRIEWRASHSIVQGARQLLAQEKAELARTVRDLSERLNEPKESKRRSNKKAPSTTSRDKVSKTSAVLPAVQQPPKQPEPPKVEPQVDVGVELREQGEAAPDAEVQRSLPSPLAPARTELQIVHVTQSRELFNMFVEEWLEEPEFVWNVHAKTNNEETQLEGLSICWTPHVVYYVDLTSSNFDWESIAEVFKSDSVKISFDVKGQLKLLMLNKVGPISSSLKDPKVAAWCLDPETKERNLKQMMKAFFPQLAFDQPESRLQICCWEAVQSYHLMEYLERRLQQEGQIAHFLNVEMPLATVLAQMELVGVGFNPKSFAGYWQIFSDSLKKLELQAYELAGHAFSLTNLDQIAVVLFDQLKLPYPQHEKQVNKKGTLSIRRRTNKEVLKTIVDMHPLPGILMEHRRISALVSKHLFPLVNGKAKSSLFDMYRIHCTNDFHTATGRISTYNPNLQNVPHPKRILSGDEKLDIDTVNIRESFEASAGNALLSADYSQLELRIIAHLSQDQKLLRLLRDGGDLFIAIAGLLFPGTTINDALRKRAKFVTYGVMYGIGPKSLSEELGVTVAEAESFIKSFKETYSGISEFHQQVVRKCTETGVVETILGRKRYLPAIHAKSIIERSHAERQALNTTIQGSAADLVKKAMISIQETFQMKYGCWYSRGQEATSIRNVPVLILQIHDELLLEVPEPLIEEVRDILTDCMSNAVKLSVPLPVRVKVGRNWGNLQDI